MTPDSAPNVRAAALEELVRQGERIIDGQLALRRESNVKTEQGLKLTLAVLTGAAAVGNFLAPSPETPRVVWPFAVLLGGSIVASLVALLHFLEVYVGLAKFVDDAALGWDPDPLTKAAARSETTREWVDKATLAAIGQWWRINHRTAQRASHLRKGGFHYLVGSSLILAIALIYALLA